MNMNTNMNQAGPSGGLALSRLHLAAALIEYDNDDEEAPPDRYKSHRDSAIFRDLQRHQQQQQQQQRQSQPPRIPLDDQHTTARPSSLVSQARPARMRDSATMEILEGRHGRSFSGSREEHLVQHEGAIKEEQEEEADVDVSRWDLPDHLISTEPSVPPPAPASSSRPVSAMSSSARPASRPFPLGPGHVSRDMNVMDGVENEDAYGIASALESAERVRRLAGASSTSPSRDRERERTRSGGDLGLRPARGDRRVSFNELELDIAARERPSTSMGLMPTSPRSARGGSSSNGRSPLNPVMIPLPTSPTRSRHSSYLAPVARVAEEETVFGDDEEEAGEMLSEEPNPFAMPAPPPQLGSRFDPKQLEAQRSQSVLSNHHRQSLSESRSHSTYLRQSVPQQNPLPTSYRHSSYMTDLPDEQDITDIHHSAQVYDEIPTAEQYGKPLMAPKYTQNRPQRMSRHDLLRPKTLIMPSMLADIPPPASPPKKKWEIAPDGFSIGEKPLPAGARTSAITIGGVPRLPLSLSQRTFRSSLMVGGQRGEAWVGGAEEEGEVAVGKKERDDLEEELRERKPGKLYGKSLIDQLEARKQAMKGQQRQFAGDSRPAMMARHSVAGPATSPTARRGPLLHFDENGNLHESPNKPEHPHRHSHMPPGNTEDAQLAPPSRPVDRLTKSTSVFGVDQIWEKEMAKLRIIQANEAEQRRQEEEKERIKQEKKEAKKNKGKKSKKGKDKEAAARTAEYEPVALDEHEGVQTEDDFSPIKKTDDLPPMLHFSPEKPPARPPPPTDPVAPEVSSSDSEEDVPLSRIKRPTSVHSSKTVPAPVPEPESSDDEDGNIPLSRLRKPKPESAPRVSSTSPAKPVLALNTDFGPGQHVSDDLQTTGSLGLSLPSAAREKALQHLTQPTVSQPTGGEEDDDDVPLLLRQAHMKATSPANEDDDDDVPLGLRQSMRQSQASFNFQPPHPASYMPQHPPQPLPHTNSFYQHPQYAHSMMSMYGFPPPQPQVPHGWGRYPGTPVSGYPFPPMHQQPPMPMPGNNMGMPPMNMTMPPLPQFAMMTSPSGQQDNIDNWRKGIAPPSVSGESRG